MGRGFSRRRSIRYRIRRVIALDDLFCNLDVFGGEVNGYLGVIQNQGETILRSIVINDPDHLLADLINGLVAVVVEIVLGILGRTLQLLLLLFRVAIQPPLLSGN